MKQYPSGILSVVSDSFDLWQVCTKFVTELREEILSRDGKLVIRPDSGDPVDILCGNGIEGDYYNDVDGREHCESKGVIELLWNIFGGTINEQGYKVLDPHIGAIYGDSITIERADEICRRLEVKGFASTNVVLGVGSYSMGYATRDNQGGAVKATYVEVNGEGREIFKDPITDDGTKKSATGLLRVTTGENGYKLVDRQTWAGEQTSSLKPIYEDGIFYNPTTLNEIREKLKV
jgi:nicotinamide phosphoribosyltransferase